jgi:hypothetical protein
LSSLYHDVHPHLCAQCRSYSDVCDKCWGVGRRGRASCRYCRGTGAYVRHGKACMVGRLGEREFTKVGAVQARFTT